MSKVPAPSPRRPPRSASHLSRIAEVMDVGVLLLDDTRQVEFASERARELLAMNAHELNDDWEHLVRGWAPLLDQADTAPDGSVELDVESGPEQIGRALRLLIHRVDDHEEAGFLVLIRDLGTARALEQDLQMAARLRGLMGLYMGVTHDLRAPLNAMALNVELIKRSLDDDHPEAARQRRRIEILEEELGRLQRALDRLLAQAAPAPPEAVRYDLGAVVADLGELLAPQARQQKVTLEVDVPEERLLTYGVPDLAKQALVNLAVNGFEAMPEGGSMRLAAFADGDEMAVTVSDSGGGIADSDLSRIFNLHFTTKPEGTGIGLYVTRSMIQSQGGTLRITETGCGKTTFEIRLPGARSSHHHAATEVA